MYLYYTYTCSNGTNTYRLCTLLYWLNLILPTSFSAFFAYSIIWVKKLSKIYKEARRILLLTNDGSVPPRSIHAMQMLTWCLVVNCVSFFSELCKISDLKRSVNIFLRFEARTLEKFILKVLKLCLECNKILVLFHFIVPHIYWTQIRKCFCSNFSHTMNLQNRIVLITWCSEVYPNYFVNMELYRIISTLCSKSSADSTLCIKEIFFLCVKHISCLNLIHEMNSCGPSQLAVIQWILLIRLYLSFFCEVGRHGGLYFSIPICINVNGLVTTDV